MASLPTANEVERAILTEIGNFGVRTNEIFPIMQITLNLQKKGFHHEEIVGSLSVMVEKNWLEPSNGPHWRLLEEGFKAI